MVISSGIYQEQADGCLRWLGNVRWDVEQPPWRANDVDLRHMVIPSHRVRIVNYMYKPWRR
jgi:hypothetical protein